jgi:CRP-like cAMP-binding protein
MSDDMARLQRRFGKSYALGDAIFTQGEKGSELFIVLAGAVEFAVVDEDGERHPLGRAGPGDLFGEMSCFSDEPRSATASAIQPTTVLRFERAAAVELVSTRPDFAMKVVRTLAARLRAHLGTDSPHATS